MFSFRSRNKVGLLHLSFWCVYLSFSLYQISQFRRGPQIHWAQAIEFTVVQLVFNMLIAYINYFFLLPRLIRKRNIWLYLLEFTVPFTLLITIRVHLLRFMVDGYTYQEHFFYSSFFIVQLVAITLFLVIFVGMLWFVKDWFDFEAKKKAIENEKLTAELNFLKAQINPHFLFNTLNNLYYLAFTQSPNTTEVIEKLSAMMRYMIYDSNHAQVPLRKEITYMENYISLEKLRLNNEIPIRFEVRGETDTVLIAPLIFITFLENAFKHGVTNNDPESWIDISVNMTGNTCIYTVKNSKIKSSELLTGNKSGIGLQNVKRRLELSYPDQYELKVEDLPQEYAVELTLKLATA